MLNRSIPLILVLLCASVCQAQKTADDASLGFIIAVDNSKSMAPYFGQMLKLTKLLVDNKERMEEAAIVRFVGRDAIETVADFTVDKAILLERIDQMYTELGQSAIVDALYLCAKSAAERGANTAVILVTDGEDRNSYYKPEFVYSYLRDKRIPVFTIGLVSGLSSKSRGRAVKLLAEIAKQGDGHAFFIDSEAEIPGVAHAALSWIRKNEHGIPRRDK